MGAIARNNSFLPVTSDRASGTLGLSKLIAKSTVNLGAVFALTLFSLNCLGQIFNSASGGEPRCIQVHALQDQAANSHVGPGPALLVASDKTDLTLRSIGEPQVFSWYQSALKLVEETPHDPSKPFVTLVVPAYKEAKRIQNSIDIIKTFFGAYPFPVEVHFRIELSPDNTAEIAENLVGKDPLFKVFAHPVQRGKGYAVRQGMLEAQSPFVFFMDADLSTPLFHVFEFLEVLRNRNDIDVLVGDRKREGASVHEYQPLHRRVMSQTFGLLTKACMGGALAGAKDTQCGFKAFRAAAAQSIFSNAEVNGFAFDLEVFILAQELGISIHPLPVQWKNDERSTVHPIWDPLKMLRTMLGVRKEVQSRLQQK